MTEEKYWDIMDNITEVRFGSYQDMPGDDDETDDLRSPDHYNDEDVDLIMDVSAKSDIGPTEDEPFNMGEWDGEGFDLKPLKRPESDRTVDADKMAYMWERYVTWKKYWFPNEAPFMEDFARYMKNFHQYDIKG